MIRPVLVSIGSRAIAAVLNFATMVLLSRYLGAEGKGLSSLIIVIISGIQVICDFFGGAALVYLASRHRLINLLFPAWIWSLCCSITAAFILSNFYGGLMGWSIAGLSFLCSTLNQHIHLLNGRKSFTQANILAFLQALLIFFVSWLFLTLQPTVSAYIFSLAAGWGLPWLVSLMMLKKLPKLAEENSDLFSAFRQLIRFGAANQTGHLIQYFTQRVAFYMLPAAALGVYSNAVTLSESLWMLASAVAMVQYGSISNSHDKAAAAKLTLVLMKLVFVATATGGLLLCLLPSELFVKIFGIQFSGVATLLPLLYPGICLMSGYLIIGHYFSGTGQFRKNNLALLSGLITCCAGYIILSGSSGFSGMAKVALVTAIANCTIFFSVLWLFMKDTGFRPADLLPGKRDIAQIKIFWADRGHAI